MYILQLDISFSGLTSYKNNCSQLSCNL